MNNDLISRKDLRKEVTEKVHFMTVDGHLAYDKMLKLIDSAPTVPIRDYSQGWHDAITKALNEAYTVTTDDGTFKVVQTETLEGLGMSMPMPERPQGEWILNKDENPECPFCHHSFTYWGNFCGNCGADMR